MKVLIATTYFPQTSETFILDHATSLIKAGIEVSVLSLFASTSKVFHKDFHQYRLEDRTINERSSHISRLSSAFIQLKQATYALFRYPKCFFSLLRDKSIKKKRTYFAAFGLTKIYRDTDIIHAHFGNVGLRMTNLKKIGIISSNTPIVCSFHGSDIDDPIYRQQPNFYSQFFKEVSLIVSNSAYIKNRLLEIGCNNNKIVILKNGINLNDFFPTAATETKSKNNTITILTVARLTEFKGLQYGVKAVKLLVDDGVKSIKYIIVGDGELRNELEKLVEDLALSSFVTLVGMKSRQEIINHYSESDIFILPGIISAHGRVETQGIVLQEAQAMGLPVITTNVGGIPEGVLDKKTGFLVEQKNANQLAEKIKLLIHNPDLRLTMGKAAAKYVGKFYDQNKLQQQVIQHYKNLVA